MQSSALRKNLQSATKDRRTIDECWASFGNSLLYATTKKISHAAEPDHQLSTNLETGDSRWALILQKSRSLSLDHVTFRLINMNMLGEKRFREGRLIIVIFLPIAGVRCFCGSTTSDSIQPSSTGTANVSYRHLTWMLQIEVSITGIEEYKGFKVWWWLMVVMIGTVFNGDAAKINYILVYDINEKEFQKCTNLWSDIWIGSKFGFWRASWRRGNSKLLHWVKRDKWTKEEDSVCRLQPQS